MPGQLAFIHALLRSTITEYTLLVERNLDLGLSIFVAQLDFTKYIFIEDNIGLHCVEWFEASADVAEKVDYWTERLASGILKTRTFNIPPDSLKSRKYTFQPKEKKEDHN
jgi:hypothetical protein